MEKGKYQVNEQDRTVTFGHETKTLDGKVTLTTTFDFSKVSLARLLYFAGTACLIKWRASSGIKGLATVEAAKLDNTVVDCSKSAERVKHVETEEEKAMKALLKDALASGKDLKAIMAKVREALAKKEEDELEAGETME